MTRDDPLRRALAEGGVEVLIDAIATEIEQLEGDGDPDFAWRVERLRAIDTVLKQGFL